MPGLAPLRLLTYVCAVTAATPSGFFVLRTPLLAVDTLLGWSSDLKSPSCRWDAGDLERAVADDRILLRARLMGEVDRPEVREAIFIASPDLHNRLGRARDNAGPNEGERVDLAVARYFLRMVGRATPYGLFAGVSLGSIANATRLAVAPRSSWKRHVRLDMGYLSEVCEGLLREKNVRRQLLYYPNSSLYTLAGQLRYVEYSLDGDHRRIYRLSSVEDTPAIQRVLETASIGASFNDLAGRLIDDEVTKQDAEEFIDALIDAQLLVPGLQPALTGSPALLHIIETLDNMPDRQGATARLQRAGAALAALSAEPLGLQPRAYRTVAETLRGLPAGVNRRLFHVDLHLPDIGATLGSGVVAEIIRGVTLLRGLDSSRAVDDRRLSRFRRAFRRRYGDREVPLTTVLDEENGLDWGGTYALQDQSSPLLDGLQFPRRVVDSRPQGPPHPTLLRKVVDALQHNRRQVEISNEDLGPLDVTRAPRLPPSFSVIAKIEGRDSKAVSEGDFAVYIVCASAASGMAALGRFCEGNAALCEAVRRHLRMEEASRPDAIFAELVHLPQGRHGNILARPTLRQFEIPYLGYSGAAFSNQIRIGDLRVSVIDDRIVLRSERLRREVIPRLSAAHNPLVRANLSLYRFLFLLQSQASAVRPLYWGMLADLAFLPRIVSGRVVLSLARWRVSQSDIALFDKADPVSRFRAVQVYRAARDLPRFVVLVEGDNDLLIDLNNSLCVDVLVQLLKKRKHGTLSENFPSEHGLAASGPDGRFTHELIIPFNGSSQVAQTLTTKSPDTVVMVDRDYEPGSEWLFAKIYTGPATADRVLRTIVGTVTRTLLEQGAIDKWFFIRYADPEHHLRLRYHGNPQALLSVGLPLLREALGDTLTDGSVTSLVLDTYRREVERYGGAEGVIIAEEVFHADSETVLALLAHVPDDGLGADYRWRLCLYGIDNLLTALDVPVAEKMTLVRHLRQTYGGEAKFRTGAHELRDQMGKKYRAERERLESMLSTGQVSDQRLAAGLALVRARAETLRCLGAKLRALEATGRLGRSTYEILGAFAHMHVNRMMRTAHKRCEFVLYDLLARVYSSFAARSVRLGEHS